MRKKEIPPLLLLIFLIGFPQISETIYTPALPDVASGLHATENQVQFTLSVYFIGFAVGVYFWGRLSDSQGRRSAMLFGIFMYTMGSVGCFLSSSIELLLIYRFIQAFGASVGSVVTQAILRESIPASDRHDVFAKVSAALAFTPAIGPLIGGWMNQFFGYSSIFITLIVMGLLIWVYTYVSLPETGNVSSKSNIRAMDVFKRMVWDPKVWSFAILIGITNGIIFSYYAEAPFLFMEHFAMTSGMYGFLGIVVAGASIVGAMLSKRLLCVYSPEKIIFIGCVITLIGTVFFSIVSFVGGISYVVLCVFFLLSVFILLLGIGMMIPNCLSLALVEYRDVLGTAGAILGLKYYLLVSLITSGMSYFHNDSITTMPLYFLGWVLVMFVMSWRIQNVE